LEIQDSSFNDFDSEGQLITGTIPGSEGGCSLGFGLMVGIDTRNNLFYPSQGIWAELSALTFNKEVGSDYNFSSMICDLRYF